MSPDSMRLRVCLCVFQENSTIEEQQNADVKRRARRRLSKKMAYELMDIFGPIPTACVFFRCVFQGNSTAKKIQQQQDTPQKKYYI